MKLSTNSLLCTTGIFTTEELALKLLELSPSTSSTVAFLASIEYPIQAAMSALKALPWEQPSVTTFGFADVVSLAGKRVVRKPISGMGSTSRAIVEEKEGEVQTEDLLLALLLCKGVGGMVLKSVGEDSGCDVVGRVAAGMGIDREDGRVLVESIGGGMRRAESVVYGTRVEGKGGEEKEEELRLPMASNMALSAVVEGPTSESNWIIPGRLLIGEVPGGWDRAPGGDVEKIVAAGVTTFVSLLEYEPEYREVLGRVAKENGVQLKSVSFPIDDFSVASDALVVAFVEELVARIVDGECVYVHCFSGRGRTGSVVIPVMMGLFPQLESREAVTLCNLYKRAGRSGRTRGGEMPEVNSQKMQVERNEGGSKRAGFKGKAGTGH